MLCSKCVKQIFDKIMPGLGLFLALNWFFAPILIIRGWLTQTSASFFGFIMEMGFNNPISTAGAVHFTAMAVFFVFSSLKMPRIHIGLSVVGLAVLGITVQRIATDSIINSLGAYWWLSASGYAAALVLSIRACRRRTKS